MSDTAAAVATYNVSAEFEGATHSFPCRADQTVLNAAEAAGVTLPSSCCSGVCTTCAAVISEGSVEHGLLFPLMWLHATRTMWMRTMPPQLGTVLSCGRIVVTCAGLEVKAAEERLLLPLVAIPAFHLHLSLRVNWRSR